MSTENKRFCKILQHEQDTRCDNHKRIEDVAKLLELDCIWVVQCYSIDDTMG